MPSAENVEEGPLHPNVTDRKGKGRASHSDLGYEIRQEPEDLQPSMAGSYIPVQPSVAHRMLQMLIHTYELLPKGVNQEEEERMLHEINDLAAAVGHEVGFTQQEVEDSQQVEDELELDYGQESAQTVMEQPFEEEQPSPVDAILENSRSLRLSRAGLLSEDDQRLIAEQAAMNTQRATVNVSRRASYPAAPYAVPPTTSSGMAGPPQSGPTFTYDYPIGIPEQPHTLELRNFRSHGIPASE